VELVIIFYLKAERYYVFSLAHLGNYE